MSYMKRAIELLREGFTPDEAYALVAAERRASEGMMEGARAAADPAEVPRVQNAPEPCCFACDDAEAA